MRAENWGCGQCGKDRIVFRRGICVHCYNGNITRKRFDRIVASFTRISDYNQFLFDLYATYRREAVRIEFQFIKPTEALIEKLEKIPLAPIRTWFDVYTLSHEWGLGPYGDRRGCPVFTIGKQLAKHGHIEKSSKCYSFFKCYLVFSPGGRALTRQYVEQVLLQRHHIDVALKRLGILRRLADWKRGEILCVTMEDASKYLDHISTSLTTIDFREHHIVLLQFYNWMTTHRHLEKNPFAALDLERFRRKCPRCSKTKIISNSSSLCRLCLIDERMIGYIEGFRRHLAVAPTYHQYLFEIYLTYTKRYRVTHTSWSESKIFLKILTSQEVSPLLSWRDVSRASALFRRQMGNQRILKGCPFIKVGRILEELGVLPMRPLDEYSHLDRVLLRLTPDTQKTVKDYIRLLSRRHRRATTGFQIVLMIIYFEQWLIRNRHGESLLVASEKSASDYLAQLAPGSRGSRHGALLNFFKWCKSQKLCYQNPFANIPRSKPTHELKICSPEQISRLLRYLKNPASNSSDALMVALALYWGFGQKEIAYSTFEALGDRIKIKVYQRPASYAHRTKTRAEFFILPNKPKWFFELQARFLNDWERRFEHLDWPKGARALFPLSSGIYNRPMTRTMVAERFARITKEATGLAIPSDVVRCTAGHINTNGSDASLLTQLGWADASAFRYTWVPRKFHS